MKDEHRVIFRQAAIQHYARSRVRSVLPHFVLPRVTTLIWVLAGMLLCCGFLAWLVRVPVYAAGVGVVIEPAPSGGEAGDRHRLAVFLPDKERSNLQVGQRVVWNLDPAGGRVNRTLVAIEREVSSPAVVQARFKLTGAAAAAITKPVVIAFVNLEPLPGDLPASTYVGAVYRVDVEVRSMRAISLLPFTSRFSKE